MGCNYWSILKLQRLQIQILYSKCSTSMHGSVELWVVCYAYEKWSIRQIQRIYTSSRQRSPLHKTLFRRIIKWDKPTLLYAIVLKSLLTHINLEHDSCDRLSHILQACPSAREAVISNIDNISPGTYSEKFLMGVCGSGFRSDTLGLPHPQ